MINEQDIILDYIEWQNSIEEKYYNDNVDVFDIIRRMLNRSKKYRNKYEYTTNVYRMKYIKIESDIILDFMIWQSHAEDKFKNTDIMDIIRRMLNRAHKHINEVKIKFNLNK